MKTQPGDEAGRAEIASCHHWVTVDDNGHLPVPVNNFQLMPLVDVAAERRKVIVLSVDRQVPELGADTAGASRHRQSAVHKPLLTIDFGHDPGTGRVAQLRHFDPRGQPEIICVRFNPGRKEGVEVHAGILRIDLAGQKRLSVQAQDTLANGGIGMDINGQPAGDPFFTVEKPFIGRDADIDGLYDPVICEKLGDMIAGLIVDIGERMVVLIDANPPVPVPGLLNEKAVAAEVIDIIGKDNRVGNGVWSSPANGERAGANSCR